MKLNYKNNNHLQQFAKALILVKYQIIVKTKDIVLLEAGFDKNYEIDYLLFRYTDVEYKYRNNKLEMIY